jgi:TetR/AcrR family transcriptional regulator, cholesterol catabolism regulator
LRLRALAVKKPYNITFQRIIRKNTYGNSAPFFCFHHFVPLHLRPEIMKENKQYLALLTKSRELFMKHGVKSLTMDEIAKQMGMSKKTIYLFVENKADLVKITMQDFLQEEQNHMSAIMKNSNNSVDELINMIDYFLQVVREFNATTLNEVKMYYPETWQVYNEYRFNYMLGLIEDNLKKGVAEGFYRANMDTDIISKIYILAVEILLNQELFPTKQYSFVNIYREFLSYHLRGIVSEKGLKYIDGHNLFKS